MLMRQTITNILLKVSASQEWTITPSVSNKRVDINHTTEKVKRGKTLAVLLRKDRHKDGLAGIKVKVL
jgi:hypothetical protein